MEKLQKTTDDKLEDILNKIKESIIKTSFTNIKIFSYI